MFRQFAFGLAVFFSSACGLVIEIVAGRLIAPYVGMSLYTWTAIIAVVLAGLSVGHWIGGRLAQPWVDIRGGCRRVALALGAAAVSSLASLALLRTVSIYLLNGPLPTIPAIVALTAALFLLPSLFVGIVSPILTKLAIDDVAVGRHGMVIGRMYALGTLGSIAGTLAAGYFFISWIGSTGTVVTVAVVYAVLALAFAIADPLRAWLVLALAVLGGGIGALGHQAQAFRSPCHVESDYFCIRVEDFRPESGRESAMMVLDHLVHGINDKADPSLLYSPYLHFTDEIAKRRFGSISALRALFVGGGAYTLPRAWANDYARDPRTRLIVAEIDPVVTAVAKRSLWLDDRAAAVDIRHGDGRMVLQSLPPEPAFDVVFSDAFHDIAVPAHLVTREFHREIAKRLRPGGFYAVNVIDEGSHPSFLLSYAKTLGLDFRSVEVWLERDQAAGGGRLTFVVLASDRATDLAMIGAARGLERTWVRWPPADLKARIERPRPVLTDDFAPVDRLLARVLMQKDG